MATQIQLRRGDAADWTSANPTLAEGEIGLELDTSLFKIGDGTTAWNSLPYGFTSIPVGGTTGQILAKDSDSDYDYVWIDNATDSIKFIVENQSGVNILKGQAVMATGATALGRIEVALAVADGTVDAKFMLGVAVEDINDNNSGEITVFGPIEGLNTSAYDVGDVLYIDPDNAGDFTDVQPAAPDLDFPIAIVTKDNPSVGSIFVRMYSQAHGLVELDDVTISATPTDGDVLTYDSGTNKWVPEAIPAPSLDLDNLDDVDVSAPTDGDVLTYDSGTSTWVTEAIPEGGASDLDGLTDVEIDTGYLANNQVLLYDSYMGKWINEEVSAELPSANLGDIVDDWATIADNETKTTTTNLDEHYRIHRLETQYPMRVRLYTTTAGRDADISRDINTPPPVSVGCVLDVETETGLLDIDILPQANGYIRAGGYEVPTTITNLSGTSQSGYTYANVFHYIMTGAYSSES